MRRLSPWPKFLLSLGVSLHLTAAPCASSGLDPKPWNDAPSPPDAADQKLIQFMHRPTRIDGSLQPEWQTDAFLFAYQDKLQIESYFNGWDKC
jgi:hypothetical protein